jgi:rod shape determining protein RodA
LIRKSVSDYPLVILALLLSAYGIAVVYSAGQTDYPVAYVVGAWKRQLAWFALSLGAAYFLYRASVRLVDWLTVPLYWIGIVLLIVTLIFGSGAGTAASVKGWLTIGGVRLGQPAELAKLTVVLMLARVLASRKEAPKSLLDLWKPALVVGVPWLLIMAQPDLGTGIVFIGIFFALLYWSGVSWQLLALIASPAVSLILAFSTGLWGAWFLILIALVLYYRPYMVEGVVLVLANVAMGVIAPLLWERLAPYQQRRLLVFLDPSADPRASGYHVLQSQVAIGSGGWFGKGYTLGFIGVTVALTLFLLLFLRVVRVASRANDSFGSLVAFGLGASWFVHVLVNIGMTLNLMPITGIPLPFFSYGGSFMLASWLAIGVLLRISSEGRGRADTLAV